MAKSLVIVESPSKATIINRYLGSDYVVKASVGHIRDLPTGGTGSAEKGRKTKGASKDKDAALAARMGIDPKHGWKADYQIMPGKEKIVSELKKLAKDADKIYLATDLDREGEAIAWHLKEVLGGSDDKYLRVKYPEITKAAISKAFENPSKVNMALVNAQQTRRFLDRVVGFMVSPILWKKVARGLSAGRVQSVAVELIVDKEREIKAFVPQEYWTCDALTRTQSGEELNLALSQIDGKKAVIPNGELAQQIVSELKSADFKVSRVETRQGSQHPAPPFTTSTLQQTANQRLGFSVRRTMNVAQHLYERGLITYMRTDSVNLSQEALQAARDLIEKNYGQAYLPEKPNFYKSKESAQEAHEAIRPSHPYDPLPADIDRDGQRLFELIYNRYLACQMADQRYESSTLTVSAGRFELKATGKHILFDGFRKIYGASKNDEQLLPAVHEGEILTLSELDPRQHFTSPPARYSEATLVKELEKEGIGRPSTYATIISTIQDRGYVKVEHGRFYAEMMGEIVTDRLRYSFKDLMDPHFTAGLESELDEIAAGQKDWLDSLDGFYKDFDLKVTQANLASEKGGMPDNKPVELSMLCPQCGKYHMAVHIGKTGIFLACQGYFDKAVPAEERCRKTLNLKPAAQVRESKQELTEEEEAEQLRQRPRCPKCGAVMDSYLIDEKNKLHLCSTPGCHGYTLEAGDFSSEIETGPQIECEKCGSMMVLKEGRFGKYMACTNSACGNTRKILKNGQVAPPREDAVDLPELPCKTAGAHYVLRDGAAGIFLAAHNFPKVRETRPPKVAELKRFRDRISPKFYYLADGPETDNEGNPTEVRFSRKFKQQYLISVKDDKMTGWMAFYKDGHWAVQEKASQSAAKASAAKGKTRASSRKKGSSKKAVKA
ncbi:MAG: type I DNA topoisomerase [Succinivibrio sp.]|nr:type I DNA topoisomerase [Succinivibrio sp.]